MRLFANILCVMLLCAIGMGCSTLTREQAENLSQARENARAALMQTSAAARDNLFRAAAARLEATCANIENLPPPAMTITALADPTAQETELKDAQQAADNPPMGFWSTAAVGVGSALAIALGVMRFSPATFRTVIDLFHTFLAPKTVRIERQARAVAPQVAERAVAYGHALCQLAEQNGLKEQVERIKAHEAAVQDTLGLRNQVDDLLSRYKATQRIPGATLPLGTDLVTEFMPTAHIPAPATEKKV